MTLSEWKDDFKGFVKSLSMPRDDYKGIMEYIDEVPEPHWIQVTERLPENETNVLITVECRPIGRKPYRRVVRAFHEDGTWSDMRSAYSWDDDSWDEYTDDDGNVLIPEGWFEAIDYHGEFCGVDDFVLAWMPLPEPYKGVTNGRD